MRLLENLAVWYLERRGALTQDLCLSLCGTRPDEVRVCTKWRYHTDSHTYEWKAAELW